MEQRHRIMIVDDNPIDQMITAHVLKTEGDIIVMESAMDALEYLNVHKDDPASIPNIILLDLDMPIMTGMDFLAKFREFADSVTKFCKIIVLTGTDIPENIELVRADPNVFKLLLKPLNKTELIPVS